MTQNKTIDFNLEFKSEPDQDGVFEGLASPFGGPADSYGDIVEPGAYADSLAKHYRSGTMPLMLWQHDPSEPIGVWDEFAEDGKGLWGRGRLLRGVQKADEAYIRIKAKAVRGLSIGFRTLEAEPIGKTGGVRLKKVDLLEVSIVSFPAAPRARINTVKNEQTADIGEALTVWARKLRDGDNPPIKDFEGILRDAGVPKALAIRIASVGLAKAIRSDSEGEEASPTTEAAILALRHALGSFHTR